MARKNLVTGLIAGLALAGLVVILAGCGPGLPDALKHKADSIPDNIKSVESRVNKNKDKYDSLKSSPEFKQVKRFAVRENWDKKFQLAHDELERAKNLYKKELAPLIGRNKPELAPRVSKQIIRIGKIIKTAENSSQTPLARFSAIQKTIENAKDFQKKSAKDAENINNIVNEFKKNIFAKAKADFPDMQEKIDSRFAPLAALAIQSRDHADIVTTEYRNHQKGLQADYAAFTDSREQLSLNLEKTQTLEIKLTKEMKGLYSSYTKILQDMKEEYFVTIKRESWNENSDFYNPRVATFHRQVSRQAYETLNADNLDTIAAITAGFFGSKFSNKIGSAWEELSINPTEQWSGRGHNAAEFWVKDLKVDYYHKYMLEKNGETKETDWEKVDGNFYFNNLEFLGMAILAKPYGVFEKDRLTQAAPPGMAYVGNSKYGEWKQDNSGSRFWSWYGKYALFSTLFFPRPYYYPYNSWHGWHNNYRHQKPYFGKTKKGFQKFGTQGNYIKKSPKFHSTRFVKSGGLKAQTASVRGAGAGLRGGGPKSKGK